MPDGVFEAGRELASGAVLGWGAERGRLATWAFSCVSSRSSKPPNGVRLMVLMRDLL